MSTSKEPTTTPSIEPTDHESRLLTSAPTMQPTDDTIHIEPPSTKQQAFDYFLILYAIGFVLLGVMLTVCVMCFYLKCCRRNNTANKKSSKSDIDRIANNQENRGRRQHLQMPSYQSLKSSDIAASYNEEEATPPQVHQASAKHISGEGDRELEDFVIGAADLPDSEEEQSQRTQQTQRTHGLHRRVVNDNAREDSLEQMYFRNKHRNNRENDGQTTKGGATTRGLPKLVPAAATYASLIGENEQTYLANCQECGLQKEGNVDSDGDGLFYCLDCWRQFEMQAH